MENVIFVMSALIAGIQVHKDASGSVHVNLDSSTPCSNDAIEVLELTEARPRGIFQGARMEGKSFFERLFIPPTAPWPRGGRLRPWQRPLPGRFAGRRPAVRGRSRFLP